MCRYCRVAAATLVLLLLFPIICMAQNDKETYEAWKKRQQEEFSGYKRQQQEEYDNFRKKANEEYASFLKKYWEEYAAFMGVEPKKNKPVPPVVCPEEEGRKERKDKRNPFEEVILVEPPKPQPQPIEPPKPPKPVEPVRPRNEIIRFGFYGTAMQIDISTRPQFSLNGISEDNIGEAWKQLSDGNSEELLEQCLVLRSRYKLNDWGYIKLLDSISLVCGRKDNEATLLMSWLYCQSGYKMRLATNNGRLFMLFASDNIIYRHNYFIIDGGRFYPYKGEKLQGLRICNISFPKEQSMTLKMIEEPRLSIKASEKRTLQSWKYPDFNVATVVNQNLIDFYGDYPTGAINGDFGTRWAIYANTPLSDEAKASMYPRIRNIIVGKSTLRATEELLNFVQTAFVYEYDSIVWGEDRAFFAEETLYYPYADCEDRSILFSRMARDLIGVDIVLLYYPGHLATAVRFDGEQPKGDYIELPQGRYYIADPTYRGAPVGLSMPNLQNDKIKVIMLQ